MPVFVKSKSGRKEEQMKTLLMVGAITILTIWSIIPIALAQDPNCMWGQNDILCQSSRMQQQWQGESRGNRSGSIHDERIYNPKAGNFADDMVEQFRKDFEEGFDDRFADPYSLQYDPTKDRCMMDPSCDMTAKGIVHYNWLTETCRKGNDAACRKLQAGAHTPAPSFRYPNGEQMNIPRPPGYEPYRGDR